MTEFNLTRRADAPILDPEEAARLRKSFEERLPAHKCSLSIVHNDHLDSYGTIEDELEFVESNGPIEWATPTSRERAIATNSLWRLQWYPETPIGFCAIYGATLEEVVQAAEKEDGE